MGGTEERHHQRLKHTQPWATHQSAEAIAGSAAQGGDAVKPLPVMFVGAPPSDATWLEAAWLHAARPRPGRVRRPVPDRATIDLPQCRAAAVDRSGPAVLRHDRGAGARVHSPASLGLHSHMEARIDSEAEASADDMARQALPFAPTVPSLRPVSSADLPRPVWVPEPSRLPVPLRLRVDIAGCERLASPDSGHARRARREARGGGHVARAWALWMQQPPYVAVGAAALLCVLSVLAAGLLMP